MPVGTPDTLADAERARILGILRSITWVLGGPKGAAARLGMNRSDQQKQMNQFGLP